MNYLFVHHNFPGQYQHAVIHLAAQPGNRVVFVSQPNENRIHGVETVFYTPFRAPTPGVHHYVSDLEQAVIWGQSVHEACRGLKAQGFQPDIVIGHSGWGETLFIKDVWPDVPLLAYFEFYYRAEGSDVGFDPLMPVTLDDGPRLRLKNSVNLLAFQAADWGQTATRWQASLHPPQMRRRLSVVHEGIDTGVAAPAEVTVEISTCGRPLTRTDEVITFIARNLEPYRGFHMFMRALPEILRRRPRAQVVIVGGNEVSYGPPPPAGTTFRQLLMEEVGNSIDASRVHFLGRVDYATFIDLLRLSSVHVYLTYPFVLSWSLLEALSTGCLVIGSDTPTVSEVIRHGHNGLLVDFFDRQGLCDRIDAVLDHPDRMQALRDNARQTVLDRYDLRTVALPRQLALIDALINGADPHQAVRQAVPPAAAARRRPARSRGRVPEPA
jgi:glycosyltransferase involved in cell wall biosynthesis